MPRTPLLLVDIDGVLSVFGWPPDAQPAGTWAYVDGIVHLISAEAVETLLDLRSHIDLVWCSGWEERANEHLPHLVGLGPFAHVELDRARAAGTSTPGHWKLAAIDRFVGDAARPVAWVDDELNDACERWAARRAGPTLLVPTSPGEGLVRRHADEIVRWVGGLRGR